MALGTYLSQFFESAKLRALRAKNVLACQRALRAHVPTCLACLRAHKFVDYILA